MDKKYDLFNVFGIKVFHQGFKPTTKLYLEGRHNQSWELIFRPDSCPIDGSPYNFFNTYPQIAKAICNQSIESYLPPIQTSAPKSEDIGEQITGIVPTDGFAIYGLTKDPRTYKISHPIDLEKLTKEVIDALGETHQAKNERKTESEDYSPRIYLKPHHSRR